MKWHEFTDRAALDGALAEHIAAGLRRDIDASGEASLALSGGSTPIPMLRCLSRLQLPWQQVAVTLVDDRWVPVSHPDSNERMLRETLLQNAAASARLVGLKTAHASPWDGLDESREKLAAVHSPFTVVVLGMGSDGHTASWFPQAENLQQLLSTESGERLMAVEPVTAPHQRITLTLPAVCDSLEIALHITGEDKRAVFESAADENYPVAAISALRAPPVSVWWAP